MATAFKEFSMVYEQFKKEFPRHPLVEELKNRLVKGRFPSERWLKASTEKMENLMAPVWRRASGSLGPTDAEHDDSSDAVA
ncbi:MAG TPA: hypothetical protein VK463_10740 [Desulfomonilaceae bacterium]|nr:hypothetical protein [Desulfomonilaceae bacterium]